MASSGLKVIITGSPRAGTSFVAGLVCRMGLSFGPDELLKPADAHNPTGFYECRPIMAIEQEVLRGLPGGFMNPKPLPEGWTADFRDEQQRIREIVDEGDIEAYKGNRQLILADLLDELYPDAVWIFCTRDVRATHASRFGREMSLEDWIDLTERRLATWRGSRPASRALEIDYDDFKRDSEESTNRVAEHIGVQLTPEMLASCIDFFRPRR